MGFALRRSIALPTRAEIRFLIPVAEAVVEAEVEESERLHQPKPHETK